MKVKEWNGYPFKFVADLNPDRDDEGKLIEFMPQERYAKRDLSRLHSYGAGPFCHFRVPWSYPVPGVYVITSEESPVYVGECQALSQRFNAGYGSIQPKNCYIGGQQTNCRLNNLVLAEAELGQVTQLWFYQTNYGRKGIEAELIRSLRPRWNGRGF